MKKIICALLTALCLGNSLAYAEFETIDIEMPICIEQKNSGGMYKKTEAEEISDESWEFSAGKYYGSGTQNSTLSLEELLENKMLAHTQKIDISSFGFKVSEVGDILNIFCDVVYKNPMVISYTGFSYSQTISGIVAEIKPNYIFETAAEDEEARREISAGIKRYTDLVSDDMSDLEKALVIHSKFTSENAYATEEYEEYNRKNKVEADAKKIKEETGKDVAISPEDTIGYDDMVIFTPLGLFKNNRAVCQGNSIALAAIYNAVNIPTTFCESDAINHIWNCVKINGRWYHLDETWNDATVYESADGNLEYDENGKILNTISDGCFYRYFLLPTERMEGTVTVAGGKVQSYTNHATRDYWRYTDSIECSDNTYVNGYMFNIGNYYSKLYLEENKLRVKTSVDIVNNKYVVPCDYLDFYASDVKTSGAIVTDLYETVRSDAQGNNSVYKAVTLIANEQIDGAEMIYVVYDGGDIAGMAGFQPISLIGSGKGSTMLFPANIMKNSKIMFWKNKIRPICSAVEYK